MKVKIGINGFGRIGRLAARIILNSPNLQLVAINSRSEISSHAYLLQYDSVYRKFKRQVRVEKDALVIGKQKVKCFNYDKPADIPWDKVKAEIVLECTGKFRTSEDCRSHLKKGVRNVIISAPAKDKTPTLVMGVNQQNLNPKKEKIISNSSCTTNCLATVIKVLDDQFGVKRGNMTTIHAVTDSQNLLDNSHSKDVRLRRSAMENLIPSTSGSAKDLGKLFPYLVGKLVCRSIRVPTATVSLIDLVVEVRKPTTPEAVNREFLKASEKKLKGILTVASEQLVSTDYIGNPHSSVVDPFLTDVIENNLVHVVAWYDNEWGYTNRLVEMVKFIGNK